MSGTSAAALYNYIEATGVIVPDTTSLKATIQQEFLTALGANLDIDDSSPAGVLIAAETAARSAVVNNNVAIANQINPNEAAGQFLDAIAGLSNSSRINQSQSWLFDVVITGTPDLLVPAGTQFETVNGDLYYLLYAAYIASTGTVSASLFSVAYGPIPAPAGALTLVSSVLGVESANAPLAGQVGVLTQSDVSYRSQRRQTLSLQGRSLIGALVSAILNLPFVFDLQCLENFTNASATINGITLVANSFWICVNGTGLNSAVVSGVNEPGSNANTLANTILQYKSTGCNWNGAQNFNQQETYTGQVYNVKWDIPSTVPIIVRATVLQGSYVGSLSDNVTNAILQFASNTVGNSIEGIVTGKNISPFEIASAVAFLLPGVHIRNMEIGTVAGGTYSNAELSLALNQLATLNQSNIDVVVATS